MTTQPLKGRKILVTAYDLEQSEHRGIAVYSKSLIRCLHEAGAEVWLLTEYFDKLSEKGLRNLPKSTQELIRNARILNSLAQGQRDLITNPLQRKFKPALKAIKLRPYLRLLINILLRPRTYKSNELNKLRVKELYDNPYVRIERLDYLKYVNGIVSAPELYMASQLAAHLPIQRPVRIDLRGFDTLITTCPLNIQPENLNTFVQTIHDLIPLEYAAANQDPLNFSHRLQACIPARRIFVSDSTSKKYKYHIQNLQKSKSHEKGHQEINTQEMVIMQSPSLHFPSWLTEDPGRIADLQPVSHLLRNDDLATLPYKATTKLRSNKNLIPFRYYLFNSSVEARKISFSLLKLMPNLTSIRKESSSASPAN